MSKFVLKNNVVPSKGLRLRKVAPKLVKNSHLWIMRSYLISLIVDGYLIDYPIFFIMLIKNENQNPF
jgi:hypothetical protein